MLPHHDQRFLGSRVVHGPVGALDPTHPALGPVLAILCNRNGLDVAAGIPSRLGPS